jgi:hypothetical protein
MIPLLEEYGQSHLVVSAFLDPKCGSDRSFGFEVSDEAIKPFDYVLGLDSFCAVCAFSAAAPCPDDSSANTRQHWGGIQWTCVGRAP